MNCKAFLPRSPGLPSPFCDPEPVSLYLCLWDMPWTSPQGLTDHDVVCKSLDTWKVLCKSYALLFTGRSWPLLLLCGWSCWAWKWWKASSLFHEKSWWRPEERGTLTSSWLLASENGFTSSLSEQCFSLMLRHLLSVRHTLSSQPGGLGALPLHTVRHSLRCFIKIAPQLLWRIWLEIFPRLPSCLSFQICTEYMYLFFSCILNSSFKTDLS